MNRLSVKLTKPELFAAATHFMSDEQTRYYLGGVYVQPHEVKGVYLVATDGHVIFVGYDEKGEANRPCIIQPPKGKPLPAKFFHSPSVAEINETTSAFYIKSNTERFLTTEVDGAFPDWKRVIPNHDYTESIAHYNTDKLAQFGTIYKLLLGTKAAWPCVRPNGNNPASVYFGKRTDCYGVIMPVKQDEHPKFGKYPGYWEGERAKLKAVA